ncbi:MAG: endo-1,4-beta-xylanase [candidate division KSB1 bacterium]|nr:endo-1,4-beta-xylanase [candidate division KSB1 bacterium]
MHHLKVFSIFLILFIITALYADPWQGLEHAKKQIETIRKADLTVQVIDREGNPVKGAEVNVTMQEHAFPFGSAIAATMAFTPDGPNPEMWTYLEKFKQNFNSAVMENAMKWYGMTHNDGSPDTVSRAKMWQCAYWLEENGIELRGHNGLWPSWRFSPDFIHDLRLQPEALRAEVNKRIDETVNMFKGRLTDWDLINEPAHHRDIINIFGEDVVIDWYARAHQLDPETPMYVNQWAVFNDVYHKSFLKWVELLASSERASLDGIGIQGHSKVEFYLQPGMQNSIWQKLNTYAEFGLPIKITEFDLEGYKGEDVQAQALENALILFFSHPAVEGFTLWGFWDGKHWRNMPQHSFTGKSEQAGFWREDWTEKRAAKVWRRLIFDEWWTRESGKTSGAEAEFQTRGFLGSYEITAAHKQQSQTVTAKLTREGQTVVITLQ